MAFKKSLDTRMGDQAAARAEKAKLVAKLGARATAAAPPETRDDVSAAPPFPVAAAPIAESNVPAAVAPAPEARYGTAHVPLLREDSDAQHTASVALAFLVDMYLSAAKNRTRHIALLWPAAPKTLGLVHALATLERWTQGDKRGVRGLTFPVKSNAFYPLNHIRFERASLLNLAHKLLETNPNGFVTHSCRDKDAYLFSFNSQLKGVDAMGMNPTVGELLPQFLTDAESQQWVSCAPKLLSQVGAKLVDRVQARELRKNCEAIGHPARAPDALFALDGRMSNTQVIAKLNQLKKLGAPEVVLVNATRSIRVQATGWKAAVARFCIQLETVFGKDAPGVVIVTDEPHSAFRLREELSSLNGKRLPAERWTSTEAYKISGKPSASKTDGLLAVGEADLHAPHPREIDTDIVDAEMAKVIGRLNRIRGELSGGPTSGEAIHSAAKFLNRTAALPCGLSDVQAWLNDIAANDAQRGGLSWTTHLAALAQFERTGEAGRNQKLLTACVEAATKLVNDCVESTPFALMLADQVGELVLHKKEAVVIVFPSPFHKRLAQRYLGRYANYAEGASYGEFADRVSLVTSDQILDVLPELGKRRLVFAGLDADALRVLITDDRIPKHTVLLLTQQNGLYLRATLRPLVENFVEFKPLKPRMESILRGLAHLNDSPTMLGQADLTLPSFRGEIEAKASVAHHESDGGLDLDAWTVMLNEGPTLHRRPAHRLYVYDPASVEATNRGFRATDVRSLKSGDRVFVMSHELRDAVETVLKAAKIPLQTDSGFENSLRLYHGTVMECLTEAFPAGTIADKVRKVRAAILKQHPGWAG